MATDCITQVTFHGDGFTKPIVARFDLPHASSDGGLVLVKALDIAWGLTERLAACLDDAREPGKILHETRELLQQRVFGLCAGYADCNDAARLVHDRSTSWCWAAIPSRGSAWRRSPRSRASRTRCARASAPRVGSCCTCRRRSRGCRRGGTSRGPAARRRSAPGRGSPTPDPGGRVTGGSPSLSSLAPPPLPPPRMYLNPTPPLSPSLPNWPPTAPRGQRAH